MRIGFVLQDPKRAPSGLDSYTRNLWSALQSVTSGHDLVPVTLPGRFAAHAYSRLLWEQCYLPFWARRARIDLLHMPAGSAPVFDGRRCVLTLHDLGDGPASRYRSPLGRRCYFGYALPHSARFAAEVITDSEATKRDAVERLGVPAERITVVPLAPASFFCRAPDDAVEAVRRKYGLAASYFLQVGASVPRKNLAGALAGFARFLARHPELQIQFAVTGAGPPSVEALPAETAELLRGGRTRFLGHVPSEDLAALYGGALAVVVPSFYEGFGLPVLEAFACGTPAIAAQVASLPEVGGDAALYVEPGEPKSIADAMARYACSPDLRGEMSRRALERSRRFSWTATARKTLEVYERALRDPRTSRLPRPRAVPGAQPAQRPKVLFVRLDSLGDLVLTTPCFDAIRRRYPHGRIDVVVQPKTAPLLDGDRRVDAVFTLEPPWRGRPRPAALLETVRLLRRLRRERYDYVVSLRRDLDDTLFARLCGGSRTLGFNAWKTQLFLTRAVSLRGDRHVVENHLRVMTLLGCAPAAPQPTVFCSRADPERIDALFVDAEATEGAIALAPFGSSRSKTLEPAAVAYLLDALTRTFEVPVLLLGAGEHRQVAAAARALSPKAFVDLVGRTSLPELCDVLRRCRLLVSVDSGPMHLGAALGVPTVALFGGEDPVLWGPFGVPNRIVCMSTGRRGGSLAPGAVDAVVASARELLAQDRRAANSLARVEVGS